MPQKVVPRHVGLQYAVPSEKLLHEWLAVKIQGRLCYFLNLFVALLYNSKKHDVIN